MSQTRAVRTHRDLQVGTSVLDTDGLVWEIVSTSYLGTQTPARKKWLWLRRGQTYCQVRGSASFRRLRLLGEVTP